MNHQVLQVVPKDAKFWISKRQRRRNPLPVRRKSKKTFAEPCVAAALALEAAAVAPFKKA